MIIEGVFRVYILRGILIRQKEAILYLREGDYIREEE
jgi:hypothetical protein